VFDSNSFNKNIVTDGEAMYVFGSTTNVSVTDCMFSNNGDIVGNGLVIYVDDTTPINVSNTSFCSNVVQGAVSGPWNDNGGNCIVESCVDTDGDGIPDDCEVPDGDGVLHVPSEYSTIQGAIYNLILPTDRIEVAAGTYTEDIVFSGHSNLLYSASGSAQTTIIGTVTINSGETASAIFKGFTVQGRLLTESSSPSIQECVFENNTSTEYGGAVSCYLGSPTFSDCIFNNNHSDGSGGAISFSRNTNAAVTNCSFNGNTAGYLGGVVRYWNATGTLTNCSFTGNVTQATAGGALSVDAVDSVVSIVDCELLNNQSQITHGAIHGDVGLNLTLTGTTLCANLPDNTIGGWGDGGGNCFATSCDDLDGNGIVDECDVVECPEDIDGDGDVDVADLLILIAAWGDYTSPPFIDEDLDQNGTVAVADLLILIAAWGACP